MMDDLISREAAINNIKNGFHWETVNGITAQAVLKQVIHDIEIMPSVQPEIIRCKDCKYWMPHSQLGFDEDNEVYHDYCQRLVPEDEYYAFYRGADDFCSRAERR